MFFDGHEREDVNKYRKTFFHDMNLVLPYFVEFSEDGTIVSKEYPSDCTIDEPEKRLIIMITHDKSTFYANDGCKKV